jgi:hypothetical protein
MKQRILISLIILPILSISCSKSNCHNRIQDGTETGIDCGGPCPNCPPSVITFSATNVASTSANVSMQYTADPNSTVQSIGVCYGKSHNPTVDTAIGNVGVFNSKGDFSGLISNLNPNSTYYLRGYIMDDNAVAYGNEVSLTTSSQVVSLPTVGTTPLTSITQTTVLGGGSVTSDGGAVVTMRGLCYDINPNPTTSNLNIQCGSGTGSYAAVLNGLTAATSYYVRAYAINSNGTAYGNQLTFKTASVTTPTLSTASASAITPSTALCGGIISSDGGDPVSARGICFNTTGNPTTSNFTVSSGSGIGTYSASMSGLQAATTYYVRAYATNSMGTTYGNQIIFTTTAPYYIGQSFGGGLIAYLDNTGEHGLIVASSNFFGGKTWSNGNNSATGATGTAIGTGQSNTTMIVSSLGSSGIYAAKLCDDLVLNGYSDWFLPSKDELNLLYLNQSALGLSNQTLMLWSSSEVPFLNSSAFEMYLAPTFVNFWAQEKSNTYGVRPFRAF